MTRAVQCLLVGGLGFVLACDGAVLIAPADDVPVFVLADVDGKPLPYIDSVTGLTGFGDITGTLRTSLLAAELALRPDSAALLVWRSRRQDDSTDVTVTDTIVGHYWIEDGTQLVWCPIYSSSGTVCSGGRYTESELVVRWLFGSGTQRNHRFVRR